MLIRNNGQEFMLIHRDSIQRAFGRNTNSKPRTSFKSFPATQLTNIVLEQLNVIVRFGNLLVKFLSHFTFMDHADTVSVVGNPFYAAPECLNRVASYTFAADIFSYNLLLYGLITRFHNDCSLIPRTPVINYFCFWITEV